MLKKVRQIAITVCSRVSQAIGCMGSIALWEHVTAFFQGQRNPLLTVTHFWWIWKVKQPLMKAGGGVGGGFLSQLYKPSTLLLYKPVLSFCLILLRTIGDGGNWKLAWQQEAIYEFSYNSRKYPILMRLKGRQKFNPLPYGIWSAVHNMPGGQLAIPLRMTLAKVKTILGADSCHALEYYVFTMLSNADLQ